MSDSILVVAAHPDDEIIGCGGTIARHASQGDTVSILILAEGVTSRDETRNATARQDDISDLQNAAARAADILGACSPRFAGFPDNRMDGIELLEVTKAVEALIEEVKPNIVYTHHGSDLNIDHRIAHQAVLTACRPMPNSAIREVYAFETLSSTEWSSESIGTPFSPTRFVNISDFLEQKMSALDCYDSEMRDFPHARSMQAVKALFHLRGASAGMNASEAFVVLREIIK